MMNKFWLRILLLSAALLTSVSAFLNWAVSEAMPNGLIASEGPKGAKSEVSETETTDPDFFQPNDWEYQALQSLSDRYGCTKAKPDSIPLANIPLTRNQYILALQTCLPIILNHPAITPEDLTTLEQLRKDFPEAFISTAFEPPEQPEPAANTSTAGGSISGADIFRPPNRSAPNQTAAAGSRGG